MRKIVLQAGKRVRDISISTGQSPTRIPSDTVITYMRKEDLAQTHTGSLIVTSTSLSMCEPCLGDPVDQVVLVSLTLLVYTILPLHLLQSSSNFA